MIRRIAFVSGLVLGSGISAFMLGSILTFLFTGKVMAVSASKGQGLRMSLLDTHTLQETPVKIAEEDIV
jgi:hypothetical protein